MNVLKQIVSDDSHVYFHCRSEFVCYCRDIISLFVYRGFDSAGPVFTVQKRKVRLISKEIYIYIVYKNKE
jgi:hypothetical protein